jgi:ribonuclease HI
MVMEAKGIRDGVQLALDRNYMDVEIESDAKEVLKMIEDPGSGRSEIAGICQDIKELDLWVFS